jgi:ATP phosphoribosyltransferase
MRIALPKGSLFGPCQQLLAKANIVPLFQERLFTAAVNKNPLIKEAILLRPQHIPEIIYQGLADCGLCGYDCLVEAGLQNQLQILARFNLAKKSAQSAKLVIFGQTNIWQDNPKTIVAAEYPNIAKAEFLQAKILFSYGQTEALVKIGLADYGLGVVESGTTLKANNLQVVKELFVSPVVLIASQDNQQLQELKIALTKNQ